MVPKPRSPYCLTCGDITLSQRHSYCALHSAERATERDRRGTTRAPTKSRGYGSNHQRLRRQWKRRIDAGEDVICARCPYPIVPGQAWDLDHDDEDRSQYLGPSHQACNRATSKADRPLGQRRAAGSAARRSRRRQEDIG